MAFSHYRGTIPSESVQSRPRLDSGKRLKKSGIQLRHIAFDLASLACRRVSALMVSAPNLSIKDIESVLLEIQEIRNAFEAFKAAVEAGDITGFQNGSFRADGCT